MQGVGIRWKGEKRGDVGGLCLFDRPDQDEGQEGQGEGQQALLLANAEPSTACSRQSQNA